MDKSIRMLIVSSELKTRHALQGILDREGWKTVCAATVGECQEVLVDQEIALVFCDRGLTDGTYRDVLAITRLVSRKVFLVVTSRLADWDEYLEALRDGAFDLIASPCHTEDIVRVINQAQCEDKKYASRCRQGSGSFSREAQSGPRQVISRPRESTNIR